MSTLIEITNHCQTFNALPGDGGLLDQDPYLVKGMMLVLNTQKAKAEFDAKKPQ